VKKFPIVITERIKQTGGKKILPLQQFLVCIHYITAASCICEVKGNTSDVLLHGIHVVVAIIVITVQGTYSYIPEPDHVLGVYNVSTVLSLHLWVHVMLIPLINVLCSKIIIMMMMMMMMMIMIMKQAVFIIFLHKLEGKCQQLAYTCVKCSVR
jgi:hypothetical protein